MSHWSSYMTCIMSSGVWGSAEDVAWETEDDGVSDGCQSSWCAQSRWEQHSAGVCWCRWVTYTQVGVFEWFTDDTCNIVITVNIYHMFDGVLLEFVETAESLIRRSLSISLVCRLQWYNIALYYWLIDWSFNIHVSDVHADNWDMT